MNFTNATSDEYYDQQTAVGESLEAPPCFPPSATNASRPACRLDDVDYVITGPLLAAVVCCGVLGNGLCTLIFYGRCRKFKIYLFLLVLAVWDMALALGALFVFCLPTLLYGKIVLYGGYAPVFPFAYFFCNVARNGSVWIVLAVAAERYFALCHPYRFEAANTQRRSFALLTSVSITAFIYGVPRFFELSISECRNPLTHRLEPEVRPTALRMNRAYWLLYRVAGGFALYSAGPFVVLTILTIRISVEIRRGVPTTPRNAASSGEKDHREALTLRQKLKFDTRAKKPQPHRDKSESINHWMHVAVIAKFLVCHTLPTVLDVYGLIDGTFLNSQTGVLAGHFSNLLVVLNSSLNFFVYTATSVHFKNDLKRIVFRKKDGGTVNRHSTDTSRL